MIVKLAGFKKSLVVPPVNPNWRTITYVSHLRELKNGSLQFLSPARPHRKEGPRGRSHDDAKNTLLGGKNSVWAKSQDVSS